MKKVAIGIFSLAALILIIVIAAVLADPGEPTSQPVPVAPAPAPAPSPAPAPAPALTPAPTPAPVQEPVGLTPYEVLTQNKAQIISIIETNARDKWGTDYQMVKYEVDNQLEALDWCISKSTNYPDIMEQAIVKWGTDLEMVKYEYENQVEAYEALQ